MRLALLPLVIAAASCNGNGGQTCGPPEDAGTASIVLTTGALTLRYGDFIATHARDCGLESTTIDGSQVDPAPVGPARLVVCIARGDRIGTAAIDVSDAAAVPQLEVSAQEGDCTWARNFAALPTGTVSFAGYCDTEGDAFNMTVDLEVPVTETCAGMTPTQLVVPISGTVMVDFPAL